MARVVKNPPAITEDVRVEGSIPGSGRSPGGGSGNPLQYSYLENPMDRGAWGAKSVGPKGTNTTERLTHTAANHERVTSVLLLKHKSSPTASS